MQKTPGIPTRLNPVTRASREQRKLRGNGLRNPQDLNSRLLESMRGTGSELVVEVVVVVLVVWVPCLK